VTNKSFDRQARGPNGYIQAIMPVRDTVREVETAINTGQRTLKVDGPYC
jgi:hypothetical protein